jgi:hypothetical protein
MWGSGGSPLLHFRSHKANVEEFCEDDFIVVKLDTFLYEVPLWSIAEYYEAARARGQFLLSM